MMKICRKVYIALFLFFLFTTTVLSSSPSPSGLGTSSNSGPQVAGGPKVCGIKLSPQMAQFVFIVTCISFVLAFLLGYFHKAFTPPSRPYVHYPDLPPPYAPDPDYPPISTTGGESRVQQPDGRTSTCKLNLGSNGIGRDPGNVIVLDDPKASRNHADIHLSNSGTYTLTDMGSQNGTSVNGQKITQQQLYQGDQIEIGDSKIIV